MSSDTPCRRVSVAGSKALADVDDTDGDIETTPHDEPRAERRQFDRTATPLVEITNVPGRVERVYLFH